MFLYEKVASKVTSAEPPGRGNGTDQLGCLTVPGRFHYPSPGAAYSHFQYSFCPAGNVRLYESLSNILKLKDFRF